MRTFEIDIDPTKPVNIEIDTVQIEARKGTVHWSEIAEKPDVFPPEAHTHAISDVDGLSDVLSEVEKRITPYTSLEKIKPYLYHVGYDAWDYDYARDHFNSHTMYRSGACSAVRNGKYYGRNFDWMYDEEVEFVIRTARSGNRFASIGMAGSGLNESEMSGDISEAMRIVPFMTRDGINEYGLTVSVLVVPAEGHKTVSVPTIEKRDQINGVALVRYILDHFKRADEACEYIAEYVSVWFPDALYDMDYELHWLIADAENTLCLEFVDDEAVVSDADYVTNFKLYGVYFAEDGTVFTPATLTQGSPVSDNHISEHGSGLERYNQIALGYESSAGSEGMRALMEDLKYTRAYSTSEDPSNPYWYTEFVGGDLHCDSAVSAFTSVVNAAGTAYANRTRDDDVPTWQTVHSIVYDMDSRTMNVIVQEDGEELNFSLGGYLYDRVKEIQDDLADHTTDTTNPHNVTAAQVGALAEPINGLAIGKYFRVASIDADGHAVLEAVDAPDAAMKVKIAETAQTPDADGYVNIPKAGTVYGLVKIGTGEYGIVLDAGGVLQTSHPLNADVTAKTGNYRPIVPSQIDYVVRAGLLSNSQITDYDKPVICQTIGAEPKVVVKTTMDAVAVAGAAYYLGEQSTLTITMPTDALLGQSITVVFSSGATACTLTCDLTGFDFVPKANKTNKLVFTLIHKTDASVTGDTDKWSVESEES